MEKQKTLETYKSTWKRVSADPRKFLTDHVTFQKTGKAIEPGLGVYDLGTTARSAENYETFHQSVDEVNHLIARICLTKFIEVQQRLPKKGEKFLCTIYFRAIINRAGHISFTGSIIPKV